VCVCARVYCRRVNTIIGCKLVICERARVHISTKLYHPRHRSTFYITYYNVYTKAGRCLSSLLYYYFCIIIISFIAPRGTRALPPTHGMETVRQYRTPKSCSVPMYINMSTNTISYQPRYHYVIPGYSTGTNDRLWKSEETSGTGITGKYRPVVMSRCGF